MVMYLSKFDITFEFVEGKRNVIADLLSRIAERSTYKHDLPYLEESEAHLAAMQLRKGKTLSKEPLIKRKRKTKSQTDGNMDGNVDGNMDNNADASMNMITNTDMSTPDDPEITESNLSTLTLSHYHQAIIDGYKDDMQFSKALITGIESGIYKIKDGLLYLDFGPDQ